MVQQYQCGVVVEPGNTDALVSEILQLSKDVGRRTKLGQEARAMLEAQFSRRKALERWRRLLEQVGGQSQ